MRRIWTRSSSSSVEQRPDGCDCPWRTRRPTTAIKTRLVGVLKLERSLTSLTPSGEASSGADAGVDRVSAFLWRRLPNRLAVLSSKLADVFADGRHFGTMRFVGWLAPFTALVTGFIAGRNHDMFTFITSLSVMAAVLAVGMQGGALGLWALGGYIIGDLQNPAQDDLIRVTIGNFGLGDRWRSTTSRSCFPTPCSGCWWWSIRSRRARSGRVSGSRRVRSPGWRQQSSPRSPPLPSAICGLAARSISSGRCGRCVMIFQQCRRSSCNR